MQARERDILYVECIAKHPSWKGGPGMPGEPGPNGRRTTRQTRGPLGSVRPDNASTAPEP